MNTPSPITREHCACIDPAVEPLVNAMNDSGSSLAILSFEGHADWFRPPYVHFEAPAALSSNIELLIRNDAASDMPKLHFGWQVDGHSYKGIKFFRLHSLQLEFVCATLTWPLRFVFARKAIRADLATLVGFVEHAVLMYSDDFDAERVDHLDTEGNARDATALRYPAPPRSRPSRPSRVFAERRPGLAAPWLGVVSANLRNGPPRHADPTDGA